MKGDVLPGITSVSSNALLLASTVELLQHVESLPYGATGALTFGDDGVILVENKRVCWAMARGMPRRLTDILCQESEPPLERERVDSLFRRCKHERTPLGEALVSAGVVSETSLRAALERHTCEAILRLAGSVEGNAPSFARHANRGYDPRFVFSTAELLAALAGKHRHELAMTARRHMREVLVPDASGFAFLRDARTPQPVIIAVDAACSLLVRDALELGGWVARSFDVIDFVDPESKLLCGTWCERTAVVAWRQGQVHYAAACVNRPASTLLVRKLSGLMGTSALPRSAGGPS